MARIRMASLDDVAAIVAMGERFRLNSDYSSLIGKDEASTTALTRTLITREGSAILVAERSNDLVVDDHRLDTATSRGLDTHLVGMLGLATYLHPMSGEHVAGELFWWVDTPYRGVIGVQLLRRAEQWSRDQGAKRIYMIAPNKHIERLYDRLGYGKVEVSYQKELS